jgi:hypothetical protein
MAISHRYLLVLIGEMMQKKGGATFTGGTAEWCWSAR